MKCNASLGRTRLTGHYGVNKLLMTEILFGTPNSKTKGSLGLFLKISTKNPECIKHNNLQTIPHFLKDQISTNNIHEVQ